MKVSRMVRFASVRSLASLIGVDPSQVSRWIAGKPYRDSQLDGICGRLGCPKSDVVLGLELRRQDRTSRKLAESQIAGLLVDSSRQLNDVSETPELLSSADF